MGKAIAYLLMVILLATPSLALNRFDPYVDLNNIDWFDRGLYFGAQQFQPCLDLEEFYAYADSDKYDRWDRDDADRYFDRFDYYDQQVIANKNRYDNIDINIRKPKDLRCSGKRAFNEIAQSNHYDGWDDDDYWEYRDYPNEQQYMERTRHFPYEINTYYMREDKYGGIASYYPFSSY